jgi:basic membrane lipoprotein Med (substrate-binding protein (PBP1-ABC) superfamily)
MRDGSLNLRQNGTERFRVGWNEELQVRATFWEAREFIMNMKRILFGFMAAICMNAIFALSVGAEQFKLAAVFQTAIEEPWDGAIHMACLEIKEKMGDELVYEFTEKVGAADFERVLREYAERGFSLVIGDAFLAGEDPVRRVAKDYPEVAFAFGSEFALQEPNLSVFDNWIHEPSYLCGVIAGRQTSTNKLGIVAAMPIAEVNRLVHAFKQGALSVNPEAKISVAYIGSWFDPPKAKEAAIAQIESGVDLIFAERFGVFEAAREKNIPAFGNMVDQNALAPDVVVTGPVWNMTPTVEYCIKSVKDKQWKAQDLREYSMMANGGASLAPFHDFEKKLPPELIREVRELEAKIRSGELKVPGIEEELKSD